MAVLLEDPHQKPQAEALAARLCVPLTTVADPALAPLFLAVTACRLELRSADPTAGGAVYADFVTGKSGFRRHWGGGVRQQPLARAVGLRGTRPLTIVDATPGLGQDAFVLAGLGGCVRMVERSPVLVALLADALRRLAEHAEQRHEALPSLSVWQGDARQVLTHLPPEERPAVVYLDPMYPHRDGSALSKKEMRRLRLLVGDDEDAAELLVVARGVARQRVVVKRPRLAPCLGDQPPSMAIHSKNTRFDVYLLE
ncbi:MAG: class I SAM-dependent methyltransferase [Magnetococcales bacterium]|nr:class I SAM-dependent methyltransferase [Magnetococcales bacterium]